jgi:EAL domain-containing protein (putative c-di-GMP-specific phosphodiesterase class I)
MEDEMDVPEMDAFFIEIARVLKGTIGENDDAARISEHGLAVLTRQADMDQVEALSKKILKAYGEKLIELEHRSLSVSCSIGIATLGRLASNSASVIAGARKAQSEAAEAGDTAITFRPQLTAVSSFSDDRQWIERIKVALSRNDFYSVQHSIIDLEGEGEQLLENLTHLKDEAGDLSPKHFMEIADRNDLAGTIDRFIIPGLLKSFVESTERQVISLSGNSIMDYSFPAWLIDQIKESCADANNLVVQVSNAVAQANLKPVQRLMDELGPLGCKLSISNFDGERRSLQLLDHLGASYVKIRPDLTEDLTQNSTSQNVVRKIVDICDDKNAAVIADEVTDTSSLAIIWQCGVKLIAGAFLKENAQVVAQ